MSDRLDPSVLIALKEIRGIPNGDGLAIFCHEDHDGRIQGFKLTATCPDITTPRSLGKAGVPTVF
ncbi:hypothetical protein ACFQL7_27955 [Halocatena marina]|uniref:Uncharacterized protein n=1 Tax=Halocatena marina TaxID=2934937 RepID=A0ABD5YZD2_9EURY